MFWKCMCVCVYVAYIVLWHFSVTVFIICIHVSVFPSKFRLCNAHLNQQHENINRNQTNAKKKEKKKLKNEIVMDAKRVLESCELFSNFQFLVVIKRARKTVHKFKINENIYFAFRSSSTHNTKQNYYVLLMSKHNFISTIYICICICIVVEANFAIEVVKICECVCDEHNFKST